MNRLLEIYDGWKNLIFENPEIEEEAKRRMKICVNCDKLTTRNFCSICYCYMPAKVRNLESRCSDLPKKW
jgi:hypothetical protein